MITDIKTKTKTCRAMDEHFITESFEIMSEINWNENSSSNCNTSRFASTSQNEINEHITSMTPENTKIKQRWATKMFREWHLEWKSRLDSTLKVCKDMDEMTASDLNYCMKFFIADVRKVDGTKYPPRTLKELTAMIQHFFQKEHKKNWSLFRDKEFQEFREVLDAEMRLSAREGNIKAPKRADTISYDDEEKMWDEGALGTSNPRQLINTMVYLIGVHCAMRAAAEHRALRFGIRTLNCDLKWKMVKKYFVTLKKEFQKQNILALSKANWNQKL